jgi:hypothetical protein
MPNMYARGILFGKMVLELGDTCTVRNDAQDFHADLEFKTKGFFTGTYNSIAGRVKHGSTELGDVTGKWSALMEFKPTKVRRQALPPSPISVPVPVPVTLRHVPLSRRFSRRGRSARYSTCRSAVMTSRLNGSRPRTNKNNPRAVYYGAI